MQLMHCGRISHPSLLPGEAQPVALSAIKPAGQTWTTSGLQDFVTPRELLASRDRRRDRRLPPRHPPCPGRRFRWRRAAYRPGYLPEQFLSSGSNQRQDQYGGAVENRARFVLEVLAAMVAEAGGDRVGIKISPEMGFNDVVDANPQETYTYLVEQLRGLDLVYLHVALFGAKVDYHALLRPLFNGAYLIGGRPGPDRRGSRAGRWPRGCDGVRGRLPGEPGSAGASARARPSTLRTRTPYSPGAEGYTDYPFANGATTN